MTADTNFSNALRTLGFIEAISRYGNGNGACKKECSTEDFVGRITAIFSPYLKNISERKFIAIQGELKKVVCEIRGQKQ